MITVLASEHFDPSVKDVWYSKHFLSVFFFLTDQLWIWWKKQGSNLWNIWLFLIIRFIYLSSCLWGKWIKFPGCVAEHDKLSLTGLMPFFLCLLTPALFLFGSQCINLIVELRTPRSLVLLKRNRMRLLMLNWAILLPFRIYFLQTQMSLLPCILYIVFNIILDSF